MPRAKQFEVEVALDRAKDLFWEKGYEATSMDDLLSCMGINRGSFYDTFGSKRELMLAALRRYDAMNRSALIRGVAQDKSPREAILGIFRSMIDGSRGPQGNHGCLLVNSAMELAPTDPSVASIVRNGFEDIARFFSGLARQAQKQGEIPSGRPATEIGQALLALLIGLMVLVRANASPRQLESVVEQAARTLD